METYYDNTLIKFYDKKGDLHVQYPKTKAEQVIGLKDYVQSHVILSNTTAEWNSTPNMLSEKNYIYIYTDYQQKNDGSGSTKYIPGAKIGDGTSYLIDLPFVDELMMEHINNNIIHITSEERKFWNEKVRCYIDTGDNTNLVFTIK